MRLRHTFIVTVDQRDDLEPVSEDELMRAVAYRIADGHFIDVVEVLPVTVVLDKREA